MSFDILRWVDDAPIRLVYGVGDPESGGCWMSALSIYSGAAWGDHPPCVCPAIAELAISCNDMISTDEARGHIIGPHLLDPVGTATDDAEIIADRRWHLIDSAVRRFAPYALRAAGFVDAAYKLEELSRVTPENAARASDAASAAASAVARAANHASDAASAAASAVASAAARAAASAAARAADHARDAAITAARSADHASAAARDAASAADHASAAARDAARAAAYAAVADAASAADHASAAARDAARAADHAVVADAASDRFAADVLLPVILETCQIGNTTPVEPACGEIDIKRALQCI